MPYAPTIDLPEPTQHRTAFAERRRHGRFDREYPALIELLRNPTGAPAEADPIDVNDRPASPPDPKHPREQVEQGGRSFELTDFDHLRPRPGDRREAWQQSAGGQPQTLELAVVRAERYCRDDRYNLEWTELLAAEAAKIQSFIGGNDYPKDPPTGAAINALVGNLVSRLGFLRHLCLVSGRDGTRQANRAVAQAIASLGCWPRVPGGYSVLERPARALRQPLLLLGGGRRHRPP